MSLQNKNIIITGGSRGIGRAIARAFLEKGAIVLLVARNQVELKQTQKALAEIGPKVEIFSADVSDKNKVEELKSFIDQVFEERVDILVNGAGIYGPIGVLASLTLEDMDTWEKTLEINILGTALVSRIVIPFMKKQGGGRIINFSGGGDGPLPNFTAYSSSKAAILRFTESLAAELKQYNIWVNAIAPGGVNTKFLEQVLEAGPEKAGKEFYDRSVKQKESGGTPSEKAAELILFLCSDETAGITGKFFSATWDDRQKIVEHKDDLMESDIYNVRRLKPEDRGKQW